MSLFNRIFSIILALLILAGGIIVLLIIFGAVLPGEVLPYGWFSGQLEGVASATGSDQAIGIGVSVILIVGMLAVLSLEFAPRKRVPFLIRSDGGGLLTIDQESVRLLANRTGLTVESVRDIDCEVGEASGGLVLSCKTPIALGASIPESGSELQSKIKEAIEQFIGLPVAKVEIKAHYESVEAKSLAAK